MAQLAGGAVGRTEVVDAWYGRHLRKKSGVLERRRGDRVITATTPGMATTQTFQAEPTAAEDAMQLHALKGVNGATR
jgi:hypothetical protein